MDESTNIKGVVLLGPPGSGKTFIGNLLEKQGIAHYTEMEEKLLHLFGRGQTFAKHKAEALQFIQQHYELEFNSVLYPIVIESTGVSDRPMLEGFEKKYRILFIKIDTPKSVCIERVQNRTPGKNLNNDSSFTEDFYEFWHSEIEPTYSFALTVDGANAEDAVKKIREIIHRTSG